MLNKDIVQVPEDHFHEPPILRKDLVREEVGRPRDSATTHYTPVVLVLRELVFDHILWFDAIELKDCCKDTAKVINRKTARVSLVRQLLIVIAVMT